MAGHKGSSYRAGQFTSPMRISQIRIDYNQYPQSVVTSVWLFNQEKYHVAVGISDPGTLEGPNALILPADIATWIAPLDPNATWTELDIQRTAWFWTGDDPAVETLPAMDVATPVVTPAG